MALKLKLESWLNFLEAKAVTVPYRGSQQEDFQHGQPKMHDQCLMLPNRANCEMEQFWGRTGEHR